MKEHAPERPNRKIFRGVVVSDHMNKTRIEGEIDDMIYREADHEQQKKVAVAFKGAYGAAYGDFIQKMIEKGKSVPVEEI